MLPSSKKQPPPSKNVKIYRVRRLNAVEPNTFVQPKQIRLILDADADVYTEEGALLCRFRKAVLPAAAIKTFYANVIQFANTSTSSNRGSASGSQTKTVGTNTKIKSNVLGFMDTLSPQQKYRLRLAGTPLNLTVRPCRFNLYYPDKWVKLFPLIQAIDGIYAKLVPEKYALQRAKADQTPFRIPATAFTTITTNVNFQTSIHCDKGDDEEGFGNLSVIESGEYTGGETCFPEYGLGVNVRTGDVLLMDVHVWHGNLPVRPVTPDAIRLSIVCYLRTKVYQNTKGMTQRQMRTHVKKIDAIRGGQHAPPAPPAI